MTVPNIYKNNPKINSLLKDPAKLMKVKKWHFNIRKNRSSQEIKIYFHTYLHFFLIIMANFWFAGPFVFLKERKIAVSSNFLRIQQNRGAAV